MMVHPIHQTCLLIVPIVHVLRRPRHQITSCSTGSIGTVGIRCIVLLYCTVSIPHRTVPYFLCLLLWQQTNNSEEDSIHRKSGYATIGTTWYWVSKMKRRQQRQQRNVLYCNSTIYNTLYNEINTSPLYMKCWKAKYKYGINRYHDGINKNYTNEIKQK